MAVTTPITEATESAEDTDQPPKDSAIECSTKKPTQKCVWKCIPLLPILTILILYILPFLLREYEGLQGYGNIKVYDDISDNIINEFRSYDRNGDGHINIEEFLVFISVNKIPTRISKDSINDKAESKNGHTLAVTGSG